MTRIVGIGGKLASGKDTVADYLVGRYGWVKIGMSDPLAQAVYTLNPWIELPTYLGWKSRFTAFLARVFRVPPRQAYLRYQDLHDSLGYVRAKQYTEARRILQVLGTEVGRKQFDDNFWVDLMVKKVRAMVGPDVPGIIVTGIRFPNEIDAIHEDLNGDTWWVDRPNHENTEITSHHERK